MRLISHKVLKPIDQSRRARYDMSVETSGESVMVKIAKALLVLAFAAFPVVAGYCDYQAQRTHCMSYPFRCP